MAESRFEDRSTTPAADVTLAWRGAASRVPCARRTCRRSPSMPAATLDNGVFNGQINAGGVPGLSVTATGSVGTNAGGDLQLRIAGDIPISLANGALASRATRVAGTARLEADVSGKLANRSSRAHFDWPMARSTMPAAG